MTTSITAVQTDFAFEQKQQDNHLAPCTLMWRQAKLLIKLSQQVNQPYLSLLENGQWLANCLKHSSVHLVRLDPGLGETRLKHWAGACKQANKVTFLKVPSTRELPKKRSLLSWQMKWLLDRVAAALILLILGPILLWLSLLVWADSPGPIFFKQWRVGERGKLFQIFKFRTMVVNAEQMHHQVMGNQTGLHKREDDPRVTRLGRWMRKYSLDELPQLFNVLRGEMSLVGPRPWALYDAVRISPEGQQRLNALPGITGAWQVGPRSTQLDLDAVNNCDLEYLQNWSLGRDLKILLLTVPRVLIGFGAF